MKKRISTYTAALALVVAFVVAPSVPCTAQNVPITGLADGTPPQPLDAFIFQRPGSQRANKILWAEIIGSMTVPPAGVTGAAANQVFVSDGSGNSGWNTAIGDVLYAYTSGAKFSVVGIQGNAVASTAPTNLSTLIWSTGAAQYAPGFPSSATIIPSAVYTGLDWSLNCSRDDVLLMNVLTLSRTVTLPDATTSGCTGKSFTIIKADASGHAVSIATTASQTINGLASGAMSLVRPNQSIKATSDGLNWFISAFGPAAFPDCKDSTGNHTNYTAATNTFSCGVSAPILASSSFVNQGTTTTVLHGNASGAPAWGPVSNADLSLSSPLTVAQGGTGLTTAADDTILVGNATAYAATAIPLCTDTSGNHLNYNTSTNSFSCGTSSSTASTGWADLGTTVALNTLTDSVGIGASTATAKLTVNGNATSTAPAILTGTVLQVTGADNTAPGVEINGYGTGSRSALSLRRALGTLASPSQVTAASGLGELNWYGYTNSSAWSGVAAEIICEAAENFTSSANGTNCYISTTATGSTTLTRNLQVVANGDVKVLNGALAQYKVSVAATVANTTLTSSTSGVSYNNSGASGQVIFTLPACAAGLIYEFTVSTAQNLRVVAVGTDKIYDGSLASAAAGRIDSSTVGTKLRMDCDGSGHWVTLANGTRTVT